MKTIRKGAIVKYVGNDKEFVETWGDMFEVWHKEGAFVRVISLKKPQFDVCSVQNYKNFKVIK